MTNCPYRTFSLEAWVNCIHNLYSPALAAPMRMSLGAKRASVAGSASREDAKMMGITPALFTLKGR
jgi:hypothetical protein